MRLRPWQRALEGVRDLIAGRRLLCCCAFKPASDRTGPVMILATGAPH